MIEFETKQTKHECDSQYEYEYMQRRYLSWACRTW